MLRRGLIVTGLGVSLSLAGIAAVIPAVAQEPSVSDSAREDADLAEWEAERAARYDEFLARFTEELGLSDPEQVETALRETLKAMVDERFAAGEISANQAEELKTRIDEAEYPFLFGAALRGRRDMQPGLDRHRHGQFVPRGGDRRVLLLDGDGPFEFWEAKPADEAGDADTSAIEAEELESTPAP